MLLATNSTYYESTFEGHGMILAMGGMLNDYCILKLSSIVKSTRANSIALQYLIYGHYNRINRTLSVVRPWGLTNTVSSAAWNQEIRPPRSNPLRARPFLLSSPWNVYRSPNTRCIIKTQ